MFRRVLVPHALYNAPSHPANDTTFNHSFHACYILSVDHDKAYAEQCSLATLLLVV